MIVLGRVVYITNLRNVNTMTIDTAWLSAFKDEIPQAFTDKISFHATTVFSDGQIRLMQSPPMQPQTWDDYIYQRFVRQYDWYLRNCSTLIIGFDNYTYVPPAKCMTQTLRRKHVPTVSFRYTCLFIVFFM